MSLQVNFTAHGHDLRAAYESILRPSDPKNGDNWALFGYDKGTNDLKVLGQGNGGLEELQEEFMDGKVQYAFARVLDPNSQLTKFVLIAWCGDGVPESKKGLFNSHLADVSLFLKGYHLQINARCEADVTPAQIMKRLNEASGSKYSIHNETQQPERITPLQSAYKKTEIPDIAALQRNPTKPEPAPKYNIGGTKPLSSSSTAAFASPSTPSKLESRVWPPPSSSSSNSGAASPPSSKPAVAERSWKTSGGGSSYTASTGSGFNKVAPPASLLSYGNTSPEPVVNKAHQMRLEREAREKEERERIKREIEASEARERQAGGGQSTAQKLAEERRLQEEKERERERERGEQEPSSQSQGPNRVREERLAREKEERERAEAEDAARSAREMFKAKEQSSAREQAAQREDDLKQQQQRREREAREAREAEERRQQEQEEQLRQQREEEDAHRRQEDDAARRLEEEEREEQMRLIQQEQQRQEDEQQRQLHLREEEERQRQEAEAEEHVGRLQEEVNAATAQSVALGADALLASTEHPELVAAGSVSAIVLYSYDKSEENEMTLYEGEILRNVTELDVGWWSGESEDGTRSGLFPANYVEVIEHAHEHTGANGDGAAAVAMDYQHQEDHGQVDYDDAQAHAQHAAEDPVAAHAAAPDAGHAKKPSAVALYDYQAGEPNEISFAEGEAIVEIEFVTDDWWSGKTEAGAVGLFPANYVEMIA